MQLPNTSLVPAPAPSIDRVAWYRLAATAGLVSALILALNAAKRSGVVPTGAATQLLAPFAQIMALIFVTGLAFSSTQRRPWLRMSGLVVNVVALAGLVGVEFVINLVFPSLPGPQIAALQDGHLGVAFTGFSVLFLLGTWLYASGLLTAKEVAKTPVLLYAIGAVPVALRTAFPEWALNSGLALMAVGVGWLAMNLLRRGTSR